MDEIEIAQAIREMREAITKLDNKPLQDLLNKLIDVVNAVHSEFLDIAENIENPEDE